MFGMFPRLRRHNKLEKDIMNLARQKPFYDDIEDIAERLEGKYETKDVKRTLNRLVSEEMVYVIEVKDGRNRLVYRPIM